MSELYRFIDQEEFESGIRNRLLLGSVAVDQECQLRFESFTTFDDRPLRLYVDAAILIAGIHPIVGDRTHLEYTMLASEHEQGKVRSYLFDYDSIARVRTGYGQTTAYLAGGLGVSSSYQTERLIQQLAREVELPESEIFLTSV